MELNREQIIKAWEDIVAAARGGVGFAREFSFVNILLATETLELIKELTEENERLKTKAKAHYFDNSNFAVTIEDIDQIAKEIAE